MASPKADLDLIGRAVGGDLLALQQLLLDTHDRLSSYIAHRLPASLKSSISVEDVIQEAFVQAFRRVSTLRSHDPESFYKWLRTIAEHRLRDLVRGHRAQKRGGQVARVEVAHDTSNSMVELLHLVAQDSRTPSRSVAGHEAMSVLQVALAGLDEDYREAIRLRYIEQLPVSEVAAVMDRTDGAVHMLCYRGLRRLRQVMGSSSKFFSRKG